MLISTVKKYNTYTMDKKKLSKLQEETNLCKVKDEEIKEKVGNVIDNKGLVYGIYRKKELVGIYIFERIEDYFVKNEDSKVVVGEKKVDFEAIWYGESTAAFKLTDKILLDEVKEFEEKIESDLRVDLLSWQEGFHRDRLPVLSGGRNFFIARMLKKREMFGSMHGGT